MKRILTISVFVSMLATVASVKAEYNCLVGHEAEANAVIATALKSKISSELEKNDVTLQDSASVIKVTVSRWSFKGEELAKVSLSGSLLTTKQTRLAVAPASQDEIEPDMWYKIITKSDGFDNEGNRINAHCLIVLKDNPSILVTNLKTDRTILKTSLPKNLTVY